MRMQQSWLRDDLANNSPVGFAQNVQGCHGLVPWSLTISATRSLKNSRLDATGLSRGGLTFAAMTKANQLLDATGLPRGGLTFAAMTQRKSVFGCHGLAPWRSHVRGYDQSKSVFGCHGLVPWRSHVRGYDPTQISFWMPRACPVEVSRSGL